ncbi:MAG: TadE family protein [Bryobacteraceae bacterium]
MKPDRRSMKRGHAAVEMALIAPWILFLFAGAFDMGIYAQCLIATANAARVAALYTSSSASAATDSVGACRYALAELKTMPNVKNLTSCGTDPLVVSAALVSGPDGLPATQVTVVYQTPQLIPIPGLKGRFRISRSAQMKL